MWTQQVAPSLQMETHNVLMVRSGQSPLLLSVFAKDPRD